MRPIHIAIASTASKPGHIPDNLKQIARFAKQAQKDGADLLLTPEMSATGYGPYPETLAAAEVAGDGPIYKALAKIAKNTGVVVCAGFVEAPRYLAHYAVYPSGKFIVQRKHRVTLMEQPLESPVKLSGHPPEAIDPADPGQPLTTHFEVFEVKGARCAIAICADGGIEGLMKIFDRLRVDVHLGPTGAGGQRKDRVTTKDLKTKAGREKYFHWLQQVFFPGGLIMDCIEHRRALAAVNMCGFDGKKQYHIGHGSITNPMGEVVGLIHGLPNLDRLRPMYTHAKIDLDECVR